VLKIQKSYCLESVTEFQALLVVLLNCQFFLDYLTLEARTDRVSRYVGD